MTNWRVDDMSVSRRDFVRQSAAVGVALGAGGYLAGLAGPRATAAPPLRPPGALDEESFLATCIRCMRCTDACPNHALVPMQDRDGRGGSGTPTMEPRKAACMLCATEDGDFLKCTEVCPSGALQLVRKDREDIGAKVAIGIAEIDLNLCYSYNNWSCGACFRACPLAGEAMTIGRWERPTVHPQACVGCGCCERACIRYPHAIRVMTGRA
ncbi:MAG: 4Fe-4S dicluster domain-containing protein [Phycisphaerales bacterium]|nr:MAG: 4Fe-4S dicluster domain-containing protein [Phycisphaerales bacterium]